MEENLDTLTENGDQVAEGQWISRDVADARAGLRVEMGKHIEDRPETTEE